MDPENEYAYDWRNQLAVDTRQPAAIEREVASVCLGLELADPEKELSDDAFAALQELAKQATTIDADGNAHWRAGWELNDETVSTFSSRTLYENGQPRPSEEQVGWLVRAMDAAGYHLDEIEGSEDGGLVWYGEGGRIAYDLTDWGKVSEWLEGVTFDDPDVTATVESLLHPDRYEDVPDFDAESRTWREDVAGKDAR